MSKNKRAILLMSVLLVVFAAGCKKKVVSAPPPPPPPPPAAPAPPPPPKAPTVTAFTAEPSSIERGQAATLRWSIADATSVTIEPGLGTVQADGNRQVFPSNTTSYRLTASGPGGNASGSVTVTVSVPPPPPPPPPAAPTRSITERLSGDVTDAFFDYDSSDLREDARNALTQDANALKAILRDFPSSTIVIEGHCDERGSAEYNLGLGDRRATAAKEFVAQLGVSGDRLKTISYGKERPQCTDANEGCYQKNRRAHFAPAQ